MHKQKKLTNQGSPTKHIASRRFLLAAVFAFAVICPALTFAQVPPRFYWKSLAGANAVVLLPQSLNGNANPLDPAYTVSADAQFEATVLVAGYGKLLPLFGRSSLVALLVPMGRLSSEATVAGLTTKQDASGYGDPLVEIGVNLIGPKPIRGIPALLRYEPGFSLDVILDVAFPIGEYDSGQVLNLGQNRWYGRVGAPIVWQIGSWVPGRRTTFEMLPALWFFSDNNEYHGGKTLQTDPIFQVEGHLTRDFTEGLWGSFDGVWATGGQASIDEVQGEKLNNLGFGFTLGYHLNENLQLTTAYLATVNDKEPTDLRMDGFRLSFTYGWHKVIEGMKRLGQQGE